VEDLLCCNSVRGTVELCVRKRVTADQVRTADLVNECILFRDSLLRLPVAFTVGNFADLDIVHYLCTCWLHSTVCLSLSFSPSLFLSFPCFCTLCRLRFIQEINEVRDADGVPRLPSVSAVRRLPASSGARSWRRRGMWTRTRHLTWVRPGTTAAWFHTHHTRIYYQQPQQSAVFLSLSYDEL